MFYQRSENAYNWPDIVGVRREEKDGPTGRLTTLRCFRSIVVVLTI